MCRRLMPIAWGASFPFSGLTYFCWLGERFSSRSSLDFLGGGDGFGERFSWRFSFDLLGAVKIAVLIYAGLPISHKSVLGFCLRQFEGL